VKSPGDVGQSSVSVFEVPPQDHGLRLDVVVSRHVPVLSRSRVARLAREGRLQVDGQPRKAGWRVKAGQVVRVEVPPPEPTGLRPEEIPLDVVYEDADVLVVNKPAGLTVHPAPGHRSGTLVNALLARVPDLQGIGGALRPGIVHRLDKDTSGLLVVAKTEEAHQRLTAQLRDRTMERTYLAIVRGEVRDERGVISAPLGRHPVHRKRFAVVPGGRPAVTYYEVLERFSGFTLLACRLETGRTHQIRVHLSSLGHPVVGDPVYGRVRVPEIARQALHAARVEFTHPRTGRRLACTAPLPEDFARLLARLREEAGAAVAVSPGRGAGVGAP
jgi:23S rRNA pseudouridine1911/1915/1917 synthase